MTQKSNPLSSNDTRAFFNDQEVRRVWHDDEWFYSVVDVVGLLTESERASKYRNDLKSFLSEKEGFTEVSDKIGKLKFIGADGKFYPGDGANTETIFRIIQSIPSPKAEPIKQRLAGLGNQRIQEGNDPELGMQRARERAILIYKSRGMNETQVKERLQGIDIRHDYTQELQDRGISGAAFGILTNTSYSWSGKTAESYKKFKGLNKSDNLRDHMTRTEMLLTGLSEEAGTQIIIEKDALGFDQVQDGLNQGAKIAKQAKESLEEHLGKSILDEHNRLTMKQQSLREKAKNKLKSK